VTPLTTLSFVSATSGSFPLAKAVARACYDAFVTPIPLHTLEQRRRHRRFFPQYPFRHEDLRKIHTHQHSTQIVSTWPPRTLGIRPAGRCWHHRQPLISWTKLVGNPTSCQACSRALMARSAWGWSCWRRSWALCH
jgi:hypothetical protein